MTDSIDEFLKTKSPKKRSGNTANTAKKTRKTTADTPKKTAVKTTAQKQETKSGSSSKTTSKTAAKPTSKPMPKPASGSAPKASAPSGSKTVKSTKSASKTQKKQPKTNAKLRIMQLGGLGTIGENLTVIECENDMIIVDCGMGFPDDDMLGIDLVIPDFTYLVNNKDKIRGVFLTHGHEDHIGSVPYLLHSLDLPIYATRLTLGILRNKLLEQKYDFEPRLLCVEAGESVRAGCFSVEFIRVNHSIADACCFAIRTPLGTIVHSGDFKLDLTPVDGDIMDISRLGQLGNEGVLLLLCESTNAERPGYTPSERTLGKTFDNIFMRYTDKRIVIATFSSNVHRVQQIIDYSVAYGRKVAVTGRSMQNIVTAASELGYMHIPDGTLIDLADMKRYRPDQVTIVTTGSQGEQMSGLYRMAFSEHRSIELGSDDLVVISATAIPGNEKTVNKIVNELSKNGIGVFCDHSIPVHVSGHACQEELKLMHALTKPKYFMPIHGEYKHLCAHVELAKSMGQIPNTIFSGENGKVLEITEKGASWADTVPAGRVLIDGDGVGDVGTIVMRDRRHLAEDGVIFVTVGVSFDQRDLLAGPEVLSRGFVYLKESEDLGEFIKDAVVNTLINGFKRGVSDVTTLRNMIRDDLSRAVFNKTHRKPMIVPVVLEV